MCRFVQSLVLSCTIPAWRAAVIDTTTRAAEPSSRPGHCLQLSVRIRLLLSSLHHLIVHI